jgi:hypothetical protein
MTFLLEHLPPHVHLVISSRADPLLPLARLRARGELVEVRAADLRFTPDEVSAYLNDVIGLGLALSAPGRSVVSQSMMTAVPGWSMVRAQVTAWSERRSQGGASAVVIIGDSSRQAVLVVVLKYSRSHRHQRYAPLLWRLTTNLQGPRGYPSRPS